MKYLVSVMVMVPYEKIKPRQNGKDSKQIGTVEEKKSIELNNLSTITCRFFFNSSVVPVTCTYSSKGQQGLASLFTFLQLTDRV